MESGRRKGCLLLSILARAASPTRKSTRSLALTAARSAGMIGTIETRSGGGAADGGWGLDDRQARRARIALLPDSELVWHLLEPTKMSKREASDPRSAAIAEVQVGVVRVLERGMAASDAGLGVRVNAVKGGLR